MKYLTGFVFALILAATLSLWAQSTAANGAITLGPVGSPSGCAWPGWFSTTSGMIICPVIGANGLPTLYVALNGGAFVPLVPAQPAPTVSFSQITGSLAATQLPSTMTCTTSTNISATAQKETLSSCQ